jgi:hypothetical protein
MASFYVGKSGKSNWRIIEQVWNKEEKKYKQNTIPKESYALLGFNSDWSIEKAKERVHQLNSSSSEQRKLIHQKASASKRANQLHKLASVYAPADICDRFIAHLKNDSFGSEKHRNRLVYHFTYIQKMVLDLRLDAHTFNEHRNEIYKYFMEDCLSFDSVCTTLRVMNKWARFVCKERKQYYEEIPSPTGHLKSALEEAYIDSEDYRGESEPLTPELLQSAKTKLNEKHYNWLSISLWLGLRPSEVDNCKKPKMFKTTVVEKTSVAHIYQSKLTGISRDKRWKQIPLIFPEQLKCLEMIKSEQFKAPPLKKLHEVFKGITKYGGRKGFVDLMLDRGQILEDISMWLGHQSIERTWAKYRNRKRVNFTKVS